MIKTAVIVVAVLALVCTSLGLAVRWARSQVATTQADVEYIGGDSDHLYCHRKTPTEFECAPLKQFLEALMQAESEDSNYPL